MVKIKSDGSNLSLEELKKFEQKNDISLSSEYEEFLLQYNGGYPDKSIFKIKGNEEEYESVLNVFYGIGDMYDNLQKNIDFSDELLEVGFLPIADDPGGNQICIGISEKHYGKIYFWEHELGNENELENLFYVSDSFINFLNSLHD
ncbi:SMI1/KNR4 family protein [Carnobacterium maltaromaticum]|uniref:SMI1/KNR4 family protein n=1 Tax=Carnobacterium maltaromaticum TaxID=2751 RepID=UPI0039BDC576